MRSNLNPLAALVFSHIAGAGVVQVIAQLPDSAPDPAWLWGVPQPLKIGQAGESEPQAWLILRTRAHLRVAWATPTRPLRSGSARHLTGSPTWRGPRRPKTNFVDNGAYTGRVG